MASDVGCRQTRYFVWDQAQGMQELQPLLDQGSDYTLESVWGVNDQGRLWLSANLCWDMSTLAAHATLAYPGRIQHSCDIPGIHADIPVWTHLDSRGGFCCGSRRRWMRTNGCNGLQKHCAAAFITVGMIPPGREPKASRWWTTRWARWRCLPG